MKWRSTVLGSAMCREWLRECQDTNSECCATALVCVVIHNCVCNAIVSLVETFEEFIAKGILTKQEFLPPILLARHVNEDTEPL